MSDDVMDSADVVMVGDREWLWGLMGAEVDVELTYASDPLAGLGPRRYEWVTVRRPVRIGWYVRFETVRLFRSVPVNLPAGL